MKCCIETADLFRFRYYSDPQISADAGRVAYVETEISRRENRYITSVYVAENGISQCAAREASCPRWQGDLLYYLSGGQVCRTDGIATEQITHLDGVTRSFSLSADGNLLCCLVTRSTEKHCKTDPLFVKHLYMKEDSVKGLIDPDIVSEYWIINLTTKAGYRLLPADFKLDAPMWGMLSAPVWSESGKLLAFSSRVQDDSLHDEKPWQADLYVVSPDGDGLRAITGGQGTFQQPVWKDENTLICFGHDNRYFRSTELSIWEISLQGGAKDLTRHLDITLTNMCIGDTESGHSACDVVFDGETGLYYFLASWHGDAKVMRFDPVTDSLQSMDDMHRAVMGFTMDQRKKTIAQVYSDVGMPSAVSVVDIQTGQEYRLPSQNDLLLKEIKLSTPEHFPVCTEDATVTDGWLMRPVGYEEGKNYPSVLSIHGGPYGLYGNLFFLEFQLLTAAGFAVIYCNPVGSRGYGQRFSQGIVGEYSKRDYRELMAFTDLCLEKFPFLAKDRMGVSGGSYGGYMTNWIITQTDRFKAAVAQRSISNWMTMYATSDSGYISIEQMLFGRKIPDPIELLDISPIRYACQVETPLLLLHSECDMRCPIEQAEQFFVTLKGMGKEVELIRFPGENHGMSRNGLPSLRVARLEAICEFLKRYLG